MLTFHFYSKSVFGLIIILVLMAPLVLNAQTDAAKDNKSINKNSIQTILARRQNSSFMLITPDDISKISSVARNALLALQGPCDTAALINFGQTVDGSLTTADCPLNDGSYADFYAFNGTQGQQVAILLESSSFDSYLGLANENGTFVIEDDDSGGGLNSKIVATLPATGLYIVLANSALPNQFGNYKLSLNGLAPCTYSFEPTSANVPVTGGTFTFTVNTQPTCRWEAATAGSSFIRTNSTGIGSGTVTYSVLANPYEVPRPGIILVGERAFTVNQAPLVCTYSIAPTSISLPAARSSGSFTVTAPAGCYWRANSNDLFILYDNGGGTSGSGTVNYTVSTNNGANRTGTITAGGQIFTVNQSGLNCTFSVSPTNIIVNHFEHTGTISVVTQPGCAWTVGRTEWILMDNVNALGSGTFSYRILENTATVSRTHTFGVFGTPYGVTVIQTGTSHRARFDYDGDGKADVSVFRPSNGVWYLQNSSNGFAATQFGASTDAMVPADYDGDGKTDVGVWRSGTWYLQRSNSGFAAIQFGQSGDVPAPADFDGDGRADLAVFRPANGTWYVLNLTDNQFSAVQFGATEDKPMAADYDGDGRADYAVYRPSNGFWYTLQSTKGFTAVQFGISTDKPVVGDYDGDGRADKAVYRVENGTWYLLQSTQGFASVQFGLSNDMPSVADFDGDGKTDIAVFRPESGIWYQMKSMQGFGSVQFGSNGDKPTSNAFVP